MQLDRRQFLFSIIAAPAVLTRRRASRTLIDRGFARVEELIDGIYVTIADASKGSGCLSNGGIIVGRDALLLIEGHFRPEGAALEVEAARMISNKPIRAAVNTHFHLDHSFGNRGYARESIPIIAHEKAPALTRQQYAVEKGEARRRILGFLEQSAARARSADDKKRIEGDIGAYTWMFDAIDAADLVYPSQLVKPSDGRLHIDLGGLDVVVECHSAHTPGDLTISVPSRSVTFVGDLIFQREYPVTLDADMRAWRQVIGRLAQLERSGRIVPGHGPVCGPEAARTQADLIDDLGHHAERMKKVGAPVEEAERRYVVPDRFREYDIFSWTWTIGGALRSFYLPGRPVPQRPHQ